MNSERFWTLTARIYDEVHIALWAGVAALAIYFAVFVVPRLPAAQANAESQRLLHDAAENRHLCERWGLRSGTFVYARCMLDLQKFRSDIRNRDEQEDRQLL